MRYFFEDYALDTDRRELRRGAHVVPTTPQVFDLLDYLISNRERVVSKDDLVSAIWKGRIVSDAALTTRLNAARSVVGDSGDEQRLIKTLPRKGIRFVGSVHETNRPSGAATILDSSAEPEHGRQPALSLPDNPSIAVLPFQNMSGDPEQEYFADGMVQDITTALSRISGLFVIARNSSFTYKGRAVDVKQVGRELGVRYVLEGSVRKAGGRVRITCQLINALTGAHIWADRFDSGLEDIFDLQDRVTESVAGAIEPSLRNAEIARASNKPTESLDAYDLYLRALAHVDQYTQADLDEALTLLRRAATLDPHFALAKALTAVSLAHMANRGWCPPDGAEVAEAVRLARTALAISNDDPTTLWMAGHVVGDHGRDLKAGRAALDRAMALSPNSATVLQMSAWLRVYADDWQRARDEFERAIRLSPLDPYMRFALAGLSIAVGELGDVESALDLVHKSIAMSRGAVYGRYVMLHHLVALGRMHEARALVQTILEAEPDFTIAVARKRLTGYSDGYLERRFAALRAAGIPE